MNHGMLGKVNTFCIQNAQVMEKWVQRYAETRDRRQQERQAYRRAHGGQRRIIFPPELAQLPKDCNVDWLHDEMDQEERENGVFVSLDEWEYARGCESKITSYNAMWSEGRHFRTYRIDAKRNTQDCGVMATFKSASGQMEDYCGIINNILKIDYRTFNIFALDVKWFKEPLCKGAQANVRRHPSGIMAIDSTRIWQANKDSLVLPQHCEQVAFHPDPNDARWWYVIQVSPRGKAIYHGQDVDLMVEVGVEDDINMEEEGEQDDEDIASPTMEEHMVDEEDVNVQDHININGDELLDVENDDDDDDDDSSIGMNLFIDLASMGLEVDQEACRDLYDDSREL